MEYAQVLPRQKFSMTMKPIDNYEKYLFAELLKNLTVLQEELSQLCIADLDLQASLTTTQAANTNPTTKAYWAIHTLAEYLKCPAVSYPNNTKTWFRDIWFKYTLTQLEADMKACTTLVMSALQEGINDDASFQLAVTYWKLLQMLNSKCCPHTEYYLEILFQSPFNWRDQWGTTATRIQHEILDYFLSRKPMHRQKLLDALPKTHWILEILIRPDLSLLVNEPIQLTQKSAESSLFKNHMDTLEEKRRNLNYLRGLSLDTQYKKRELLQNALKPPSPTLLDIFSSQFISAQFISDLKKESTFLFVLDTPNKASFVFDGLCGNDPNPPKTHGYSYVCSLLGEGKSFSYSARNNEKYLHISNALTKQQTYKRDATSVIDNQLELIEVEIRLLQVYGDREAKYNNTQSTLDSMRDKIRSVGKIVRERQQLIELGRNGLESGDSYQNRVNALSLDEQLAFLNEQHEDFKKAQSQKAETSGWYQQKSSEHWVAYKHTASFDEAVSKFYSLTQCLDQDIVDVTRSHDALIKRNATLQKVEIDIQTSHKKFLMTDFTSHVQIPYLSLVALLGALVFTTISIGILAGNPLFTFLVMPVLTKYMSVLATLGIVTGLAVGIPNAYSVMRYLFFPLIQDNSNAEEVDESNPYNSPNKIRNLFSP